jgi:hypothetical protein
MGKLHQPFSQDDSHIFGVTGGMISVSDKIASASSA